MAALKILAIAAHPDDVEYYCAGTLALLSQAGHRIAIATTTSGEGGSHIYGPEETARIRREEASNAADLINAEYYCVGGTDMDIDFCHALRVKTVHIFRKFCPDIVLAPAPGDYHPDHEETSRLARAACFYAPIPNFPEQSLPPILKVPYLYYMSVERDHFGQPVKHDIIIDVSSVCLIKEQMLRCHKSQQEWLESHHGMNDFVDGMKKKEEYWGKIIGVKAAEAFRQHLGDGYPKDNIMSTLINGVHVID